MIKYEDIDLLKPKELNQKCDSKKCMNPFMYGKDICEKCILKSTKEKE